jgi:hypothetical protein
VGLVTMLGNVLLAPVTGPYYGVKFVLNALREQVETVNANEERRLQEELIALNMRLELGEITEPEFAAQETALLARLKAFRAAKK